MTTRPDRCARHHRECCAGEVDRAEEGGLDLRPERLRAQLLEEAGVEVARVVDQHVDPAEPLDRSRHGRLSLRGIGDVELDRQEVVVFSDRRADLLGVSSGGDDRVTSGQRGLGDVDPQAAAGAGDEPDLLVTHVVHSLFDLEVVLGTALSVVCTATKPRAGRRWEPLLMGLLTGTLCPIASNRIAFSCQ